VIHLPNVTSAVAADSALSMRSADNALIHGHGLRGRAATVMVT
jgi:hypothetical protein